MNKIFITVILLQFAFLAQSQNLITADSVYKAGIYRTFEEFKYNNPSIVLKDEIVKKKRGYGFLNAAGQVTFYKIAINRKEGKAVGEVFGFSDGKNVYINEYKPRLGPNAEFSKIEYMGPYAYYEDIRCVETFRPDGSVTTCGLDDKIINTETGEVISLSKQTLRELIANDKELLKEFEDESQKNKKLKDYVVRYNEKLRKAMANTRS